MAVTAPTVRMITASRHRSMARLNTAHRNTAMRPDTTSSSRNTAHRNLRQGSGSFFALTAPLDQPAYNCTIGEAFIRFWKKYATFKGRASRGEFWWWVLCTFIIQIAFAVIFAVLGAIIDSNTANGMRSFVNTIWALATIVPSLALSVRRLHDTNKAGTTLVILYAIDFIGGVLLSVGLVMTGLGAISVIGDVIE